jgi:hypothetical protein
LVTDGSKNVISATTTATEIGYVNGVTSAIQTQLNSKVGAVNYRVVTEGTGSHTSGQTSGVYALTMGGSVMIKSPSGTTYPWHLFRIDSSDFASINGSTVQFRLKTTVVVNGINPTGTYTVGLYPSTNDSPSVPAIRLAFGTVVSGSTTAINPIGGDMTVTYGSPFSLPANGFYTLAVSTSNTVAANSHVWIYVELQVVNA